MKLFLDKDYLKGVGGRPLVYIYDGKGSPSQVEEMKQAAAKAGSPELFIVDMGTGMGSLADAHGRYAIWEAADFN